MIVYSVFSVIEYMIIIVTYNSMVLVIHLIYYNMNNNSNYNRPYNWNSRKKNNRLLRDSSNYYNKNKRYYNDNIHDMN